MTTIVEGKTFGFVVVGKTASGKVVPLTDAVIATDNPGVLTAVVGADGSNGIATGVSPGTANLRATAAGVTSVPFQVDVTADNVVVTVEIQTVDEVVVEPH